ncbi:hypothetical protein Tco_1575284 [Tanacetum coccineum]
MTLPSRNERHAWLRFDTQDYTKEGIQDFESRLGKIYNRQVHQVQFLDFDVLTEDMKQDMTERLMMEHTDAQGHFQMGGLRRQLGWRQFMAILGLHTVKEMETDGFRAYWDASLRVIASKAEEPLRRLCHRLIAFTIAGRDQTPEKVTTIYLFFLRMRKKGAQMSEGYFIVRLGVHCRVIMEESLQTLTMKVRGLTTIDIDELIRLRICKRLRDVVTWVALRLHRQQVGAAGEATQVDPKAPQEDVAAGHEGVQADLAPVQAPQAVAPIPRTIPQRLQRLEEEVYGLRESLGKHRMLLERMSNDQG